MTIWIQEKTIVKLWKLEHKTNYSEGRFSSSRKLPDGEYKNSTWSFVRFVGKAHQYALEHLEGNERIVLIKGFLSNEEYADASGEKKYPKSPQFVVLDCVVQGGKPQTRPEEIELPAEDDIPF